MSYEPTNWKTGDVITAEKMNKLESGVANINGIFPLDIQEINGNLTINSYNEIKNAIQNNLIPMGYYRLSSTDNSMEFSLATLLLIAQDKISDSDYVFFALINMNMNPSSCYAQDPDERMVQSDAPPWEPS